MDPIVELDGVEKRFGAVHALQGVSLRLFPGRIGLLGPNGAGKSTLLRSILGLIAPDHGTVRVLGEDVTLAGPALRARLGYMPEGDSVMPELSALEYTTLAAELAGLPRSAAIGHAHRILHDVGLGEARYRKLGTYSTGMRQRARLAQALVGGPSLILLDEPTSGLDPEGRDVLLDLVAQIPERTGASVLLSTHILPDVERTCDQVVVLADGTVRYAGDLAPLLRSKDDRFEVRVSGSAEAFKEHLEQVGCLVTAVADALEVRPPAGQGTSLILARAEETGAQVRHLAPLRMTLERAFFETLESDPSQGSPSP